MAIEILAAEWDRWKESPRSISAWCGVCRIEFNATRSWRGIEPGRFFLLPMRNAILKCPNCGHEAVESYAAF